MALGLFLFAYTKVWTHLDSFGLYNGLCIGRMLYGMDAIRHRSSHAERLHCEGSGLCAGRRAYPGAVIAAAYAAAWRASPSYPTVWGG